MYENFNPVIAHSASDDGKFESRLELQNIDYTLVGYYYCVKNSSKNYEFTHLVSTKEASRIYLFVNGEERSSSGEAASFF